MRGRDHLFVAEQDMRLRRFLLEDIEGGAGKLT